MYHWALLIFKLVQLLFFLPLWGPALFGVGPPNNILRGPCQKLLTLLSLKSATGDTFQCIQRCASPFSVTVWKDKKIYLFSTRKFKFRDYYGWRGKTSSSELLMLCLYQTYFLNLEALQVWYIKYWFLMFSFCLAIRQIGWDVLGRRDHTQSTKMAMW